MSDGARTRRPFVGDRRAALVDTLLRELEVVTGSCKPRLHFIEAPLGWGKTRVVQELYDRLAARQEGPPYWPADLMIDTAVTSDELSRYRKRLRPPPFDVPADRRAPWIWLAISTDPSPHARPEEAYRNIAEQLEPHLHAVLRRQRLSRSALRAVVELLGAVVPLPTAAGALMTLFDVTRDVADDLRGAIQRTVRVGEASSDEYVARLWRLVSTVWGEDGTGGPPIVLVIEDAQFVTEQTAELLRAVLASTLPILVVATGWPLGTEERHAPFRELVGSQPAGLTVHRLDRFTQDETRELMHAVHPGTPDAVVDVLAERLEGNLYGLNLLLINTDAQPGRALDEDPEWLTTVDTDLHAQLAMLLAAIPEPARTALLAVALLGYRFPERLGRLGASALRPPGSLDDAVTTDWLRRESVHRELLSFIEPLRHEVARAMAEGRLRPTARRVVLREGLAAVQGLLEDEEADPDRDLLNQLYIDLARAVGEPRDEERLSRACRELLSSLYEQRAKRAARSLLSSVDDIVRVDRLGPVEAAQLAVDRARAFRRLGGRGERELIALTQRASDLAADVREARPDLHVRALLERARLHQSPYLGDITDLGLARMLLEQAGDLLRVATDMPRELLHDFRACEYTQYSAEGDRRRAYELALRDADLCLHPDGTPSAQSLASLSNAAYYAARFDPRLGADVTGHVIAERSRYWGSPRHPGVAILQKDLAVRLLHTYDDSLVPEAVALAEQAVEIVEAAYGADDPGTANCLSARSLARTTMARVLWEQGRIAESVHEAHRALADIELVRDLRHRRAPDARFLNMEERLAVVRVWTGDPTGLVDVRAILVERLGVRRQAPDLAEVCWVARDLRDGLRRHGRLDEAAAVMAEFPAAFRAPFPP